MFKGITTAVGDDDTAYPVLKHISIQIACALCERERSIQQIYK